MAIDEINGTNPVLPAALQRQVQTTVPLAGSPLTSVRNAAAVAAAALQNLTPAQQAALLGTEALQILNQEPSAPIEPLLDDGTTTGFTSILESEGLSPAQQAALAVNETVQTAIETENLTPAQQAALTVNQATQTLTAPLAETETTISAARAEITGQTPALAIAAEGIPAPGTAAAAALAATAAAAAAAPTVATTTPTTEAPLAPAGLTLAQQAALAAQAIQYRNAVAVYEVRNPTPLPTDPAAIPREIHPAVPIGRAKPVDPLVLRQEWERRKRIKRTEIEPRPPLEEKALRNMIRQANDDLAASGTPLHLVLTQTEEGLALDVYDCSDDALCEVAQEVPLDLNNLLTLLDSLEHESGIIVNIKT